MRKRTAAAPRPDQLTPERAEELGKCYKSYTYFVNRYCKIYDSVALQWIPFTLWPEQQRVLHSIHQNQLTVILKARQLGISWLTLSYALWSMLFRPIAAVSVFSRREPEAIYMLGPERLRGIYNNLPLWMKTGHEPVVDAAKEWVLTTGSASRAFPTSAGDGYVSTLAIVDEADLAPDLNLMLGAVKPTIDNGGKLVLLSRVKKSEPNSEFKRIYRGARSGENGWFPIFLPWKAHPGRDAVWYDMQRRDILSRTGSLDDLFEQYPETDQQALSARTLDKRIPPMWVEACYAEVKAVVVKGSPSLPGLVIYKAPQFGVRYVVGVDSAEGNENSDDSAMTVLNLKSGEEVASFCAKVEPTVFAQYISQVSAFYNHAPAMIERNNHGHAVIQWMEEHARRTRLLLGHDAETHKQDKKSRKRRKHLKAGWLSSKLGKTLLYTQCTDFFRTSADVDNEGQNPTKVLHTLKTYDQLLSIESATLAAPQGSNDDMADSFALAVVGRQQLLGKGHSAGTLVDSAKGWA